MFTHSTTREPAVTTASAKPCFTASATAIKSRVPTGPRSSSRVSRGSQPPPGGNESRPLSGKLTPPSLTPAQEQMMLGTMLGDANMVIPKTTRGNPTYRSQHGWVQHAYNCHKSQTLSAFVRKLPQKKPNGGFGKWLSVFRTLSCPAFWPIASLCLDDRGKKRVTQEWLDRLNWEGVAWWYQDDGSLQLRNTAAVFHTEGFSKEECELLAGWFTSRGLGAHAHPIKSRRRKGTTYYSVHLTVDATEVLMRHIRPYVHVSMMYKTELRPQLKLVCPYCGKPVPGRHYSTPRKLTCGRKKCIKAYRDAAKAKYADAPGNREKRNACMRASYAASGQAGRCAAARRAKAWRDANPEAVRAIKRRAAKKRAAARAAMPWACRRCGLNRPRGKTNPKTKYCQACRILVTKEQKTASAKRHPRHPRS